MGRRQLRATRWIAGRLCASLLACGVIGCKSARAPQGPAPTGTPITRPVADNPEPDVGTPLAAVRAYAEAWRDGDAAKFRAVIHAEGHERAMDVSARWMASSVRLEKVATRAYGADGAARVLEAGVLPPAGPWGREMLEMFEWQKDDPKAAPVVRQQGDAATVLLPRAAPIDLKNVGGRWKIAASALDESAARGDRAAPPDPAGEEKQLALFEVLAAAQEAVADGITTGAYKAPGEAAAAFPTHRRGRNEEGATAGRDGGLIPRPLRKTPKRPYVTPSGSGTSCC